MTASLPSEIQGVLFDKDGTVLDYWKTWLPINRQVANFAAQGDVVLADALLRLGGHDPTTDRVASGSVFAAGPAEALAEIFSTHLGHATPDALVENINRLFREGGALGAVAEIGARDAVEAVARSGRICGLATNDTVDGMRTSLVRAGLADLFTFEVAADSGFGAKPDPGMAIAFARATGLPIEALAVVGDSVHDLEMAHRAGFGLKIAVLSGTGSRADLAPLADVLIESVRDLPALFA